MRPLRPSAGSLKMEAFRQSMRPRPDDDDDDDDHDDDDDADDADADDDDDHLHVACYLGAPVSHVTPGRACHMLPRGEQS